MTEQAEVEAKVEAGAGAVDLRDPLGLAADAPLLRSWLDFTAQVADGATTPFTIPGHKQRTTLVGDVVRGDVPLYAGLDTMGLAHGVLADAEGRAAALWSADWCRFSVGGSTHGNQALALAVAAPGDEVVVSRTLHRSMLLGLVLAGLRPVWVHPDVDTVTGLPTSVPVRAVEAALAEHPGARAVLLGDPSYVGTTGDLPAHAAAAHTAGVPLVVDAAWAPHFGFHPDLPPHALAQGADAMVISAHKTLPAWSQAAVVLARTTTSGGRFDPDRLERAFEATHTTSPAGAILASTDAARALLAGHGERLLTDLLAIVAITKERINAVPGLSALNSPLPGGGRIEPAKLVVQLAGSGASGPAVEAELIAAGLPVEMADRDTIVAIVTISDDAGTLGRFTDVLLGAVERHRGEPRRPVPSSAWTVAPQTAMPPRDAFFASHETVPAARAVGRVSAELVAPYPPGIPVLAPGELVTAEALDALAATRAGGGRIAYAADPTLATLQVVARN
jgi:lysine decarboxylase